MAEKKKAIIIGAGLGGLAAALRLAQNKFDVCVFEQNSFAGGKAGEIKKDGFRFDTGPSLITMPFVIEDLFNYIGEDIQQHLQIEKLNILCKYFYHDKTVINAYSDFNQFKNEIENKTSTYPFDLIKYYNYSKTIFELTADLFLFNSLTKINNFLNFDSFITLLNINKIDAFRTVHDANSSFFSDDKIIQLFDRYATYNGSNPYKAPATLNQIPYVEIGLGGYILKSGISSLPKSLYQIALKNGVKFHFNSKVNKIVTETNKIKGIEADNKFYKSDVIISNSDVYCTYKFLLNDSSFNEKKFENLISSSAIVFYWGVKIRSEKLEVHNILFSKNYKKEFDEIFEKKIVPVDPTIYIYISSKFNKNDAPENYENWFVMINTPYNNGQDWEKVIHKVKKIIINKIKALLSIDISDKIFFEEILDPKKLEDLSSSYKGGIYGISSNTKSAAFLRQQNRSKKYKGLYFTGGSVHPGGGIPLVLLSGKIASDLILKYEL